MAVFKCKMCGGALEVGTQSVATCEYCGTQQTLPRLSDNRRANLYDRANHFRRNNEFDKAMGIYEQILTEDNTDAEAYWSLVLCRYGIEYVEDPMAGTRVPTINRAQLISVFDDENYVSALRFADTQQKVIYETEAKVINEIQKSIIAISQKEEPFDVFICYKETGENGSRTPDSVLATELYHELTQEGFKVFFSRITLEDKLGQEYEPYIFAALNSAKVMVVLGTKPEHFNAVWVKNEWSRYLALIKGGAKKTLIPAYRDMDPYDLPEEFSHLQALDMTKLGFMQDLVRGIKRLLPDLSKTDAVTSQEKAPQQNTIASPEVEILLKRAFLALEDGDFTRADDFCEQVLSQDPENGRAYLGKLMADLRVKTQDALKDEKKPFGENGNYRKAVRFGSTALANALESALAEVEERIAAQREKARKKAKKFGKVSAIVAASLAATALSVYLAIYVVIPFARYSRASKLHEQGSYDEAIAIYTDLGEYKDAAELLKETQYDKAMALYEQKQYAEAIQVFGTLGGYSDSVSWLAIARTDYAEKMFLAGNYGVAIKELGSLKWSWVVQDRVNKFLYTQGKMALENQTYGLAEDCFSTISYKDSGVLEQESIYQQGLLLLERKAFESAADVFAEIIPYKDAETQYYEALYQCVLVNKTLLASTPTDTWGRLNRAVVLLNLEELAEANYKDSAALYAKYK